MSTGTSRTKLTMLLGQVPPLVPDPAQAMTALIEIPPGDPGTPPHRHEAAVREMPGWVVLRYGLLYGPGTWYAADGMYAAQARAGRLAAGENVSSFVHADDAAAAAVESLDWPSGVVNVCDDEPAPGRAWVPAFCRAVGAPAPPPAAEATRGRDGWGRDGWGRDGWARGADNRHARHDLGWKPRYPSWRNGFGEPTA